jgi:hypothetical protein
VHRVGVLAAQLAGTPRVLEATIDRDLLKRGVRAMGMLHLGRGIEVPPMAGAYLPRGEITHRVDVRAFTGAKRAAMAAHVSQAGGESADSRTLGLLLRLPRPLFRALLGHEWFAERGAARTVRPASTLFPGAEGAACRP